MQPTKILAAPLRYRFWRLRHLRLIGNDLFGGRDGPEYPHREHLVAAIDWMCRAQDVRRDAADAGGVSAGWNFEDGWLPSYPETTGYIIETFIAAAALLVRPELRERATRMIDWELSLQHEDGAFPGHFGEAGSRPVIFNTGQIMHGMIAGYSEFGRTDCLQAAVRAGHWLVSQQDEDGCWRRFEHNDVPHVYNTRAAWALLATGMVAGEPALEQAAIRNLHWALSQQRACGWFANNAFVPQRHPFTHTIAYAIRGLLECGVLLGEERYLAAAEKAAGALAEAQREDGSLAGAYGERWIPKADYCCLTGVAQMSVNWVRLAQVYGTDKWYRYARRALAYLKRHQRVLDKDQAVMGGIAGSYPIWGDYSRFEYPNWAAKFFADALMMDMMGVAVPTVRNKPRQSVGERVELNANG